MPLRHCEGEDIGRFLAHAQVGDQDARAVLMQLVETMAERRDALYAVDGRQFALQRSALIEAIEPDWQRYVERLAAKASGVELGPLTADAWAMESCLIVAAPGFYPADHEPGPEYLTAWRGTVDVRLNLAGLRLAALLNALFPG